ncbi:putative F-box/LRR-repeat protein At3g18150 [Aristolochia californica]|uniref:putative F-box/LRR-repeat protein At3g18150 n=1 Tax=Aristolochia californica TaxID=171875 RepID=UPI0035E1CA5D
MDFQHKRTFIEKTDSINKLLENIIHHILSFLPMKCAVMTSIQSRQWINIWKPLLIYNTIIDLMRDRVTLLSSLPSMDDLDGQYLPIALRSPNHPEYGEFVILVPG